MTDQTSLPGATAAGFARKVRLSTWALYAERLWPRVALIVGLAGVFLLVSLAGTWSVVSPLAHKILLAGFVAAALAGLGFAASTRYPTRDEGLRRLERLSGLAHRPASSYEDTATIAQTDAVSATIWAAHKARLASMIARLQVKAPAPRTDLYDPFALRAGILLLLVPLTALVGDSARDRVLSAFRFGPEASVIASRLDAWVTPPSYTLKAPIMLADGGRGGLISLDPKQKSIEVPSGSILTVRASGTDLGAIVLTAARAVEQKSGAPKAADQKAATRKGTAQKLQGAQASGATTDPNATVDDASEGRLVITSSGPVTLTVGGREIAKWTFAVTPDHAPKIALTKVPEIGPRGTLKLAYRVEDDYGVATAEAKFEPIIEAPDRATAWAALPALKGPRPPYDHAPKLALKLPRVTSPAGETGSLFELAGHLYGGRPVRMTLVAHDHAGQTGTSDPVEMRFPQKLFRKPLARALIEQRRALASDPRTRTRVLAALDALSMAPEKFFPQKGVYLELRTIYHRLAQEGPRGIRNGTHEMRQSVVAELQHLAERIEYGNLSDAQRRLKELQDKLSEALKNGASDADLQKLMQELRQALADVLQQMQRDAQNDPQPPQGLDPSKMLRTQDIERMMRNMEQMMKQGSREKAQDMLSQLQDMLDQLQNGRMAQGQGQNQAQQQLNKMMNEMSKLLGDQERLMDDTFTADRQGEDGEPGDQEGQEQGPGQQPGQMPGQMPGPGLGQGQPGKPGQGQGRGNRQAQRQPGQGQGQGQGPLTGDQLGQRQGQLKDMLGRLQRGMGEMGLKAPDQFAEADRAMERARRAIQNGDLQTATKEQSRALEELRKGRQNLAGQLQRQPGQSGSDRDGLASDVPRDPLDRALQSNDLGENDADGYVPGALDAETARQIVEELRKRLGDAGRSQGEIEYIERLLRQF